MSIISWTSPRASLVILPASRVTSSARSALCSVSSSPRRLTTWPRTGAGTERHVRNASAARPTAASVSAAPSRRSSSSGCPDRGDTTRRPVPSGTPAPSRRRAARAASRSSVVSGLSVVVLVIAKLPCSSGGGGGRGGGEGGRVDGGGRGGGGQRPVRLVGVQVGGVVELPAERARHPVGGRVGGRLAGVLRAVGGQVGLEDPGRGARQEVLVDDGRAPHGARRGVGLVREPAEALLGEPLLGGGERAVPDAARDVLPLLLAEPGVLGPS